MDGANGHGHMVVQPGGTVLPVFAGRTIPLNSFVCVNVYFAIITQLLLCSLLFESTEYLPTNK